MARYIISVDVGIKNLGICVYDLVQHQICFWDTVALTPDGRYFPYNNVSYVHKFVDRYYEYFTQADRVLIERQMRCNMRIIEAVLHSLFYAKCLVISARDVKQHFNICMRNYKLNKQKAVEWALAFVERSPDAFAPDVLAVWQSRKKRDDLADSLLLLMYYVNSYSNQCAMNYVFFQL